jgi:murein DD-endopeptidase MepM/ murein hydrolase activator NlpD
VIDRRRHARLARGRLPAKQLAQSSRGALQHSAARRALRDVYEADHVAHGGGRFRWLLSTCLAGAVGALAIALAIMGSVDGTDTGVDRMPTFDDLLKTSPTTHQIARPAEGLRWAIPKVDRLQSAAETPMAKHVIHEQVQVKRDNRPFIQIRPYLRYVARLQPAPAANADVIPVFNPLKLYAAEASPQSGSGSDEATQDVAQQVVELLGSTLPGEDGQELSVQEAQVLAQRDLENMSDGLSIRPTFQPEGAEGLLPRQLLEASVSGERDTLPAFTTVLTKSTAELELEALDEGPGEVRVTRVGKGDTLVRILTRAGSDPYQARLMVESAKGIFTEAQLAPGQEVRITMVPSLQQKDRMEPAALSVFGSGHDHKVSVFRNSAGEFEASARPVEPKLARAAVSDGDQPQSSSLYAAIYNAGLMQGLPPDNILKILRIHAYETDFRRRVRPTDSAEFFFDIDEEQASELTPSELLYTSLSTGGETQRYWRFRTPDGVVDYYDEFGNNSRKFLMRRPIRGDNVHFTSGYGLRFHPLLNERRMHSGVDWAAPTGTPILAAGNGVIEEADRKGQYGNYVRIRHANGYQSTYAHMSRFGPGIRRGIKVRQGQVIGFVGTTGLSSGPHLHFEVLVNNRFVDPMQIQVPRERRLTGKDAAAFQRERQRIDELMRRAPVMTITK